MKNSRWLLGLVSLMLACSNASDHDRVRADENNEGSLQICPEDLAHDVRVTLGLGALSQITVDALIDRVAEKGFSHEFDRYQSSPPNQCADLRNFEPSTEVLWIHAGLDNSKLTSRSFVVVTDASGIVTHIEGRYFFEPPPP